MLAHKIIADTIKGIFGKAAPETVEPSPSDVLSRLVYHVYGHKLAGDGAINDPTDIGQRVYMLKGELEAILDDYKGFSSQELVKNGIERVDIVITGFLIDVIYRGKDPFEYLKGIKENRHLEGDSLVVGAYNRTVEKMPWQNPEFNAKEAARNWMACLIQYSERFLK